MTLRALIALSACVCLSRLVVAANIEADPAKKYTLSKNCGPWMIMVTTFQSKDGDEPGEREKTPEQSAQELVLELRALGMPAYTYEFDPGQSHLTATDRLGREERRKNLRRIKSVCVLAGNYNDVNDKIAQDSLLWVKKLQPKTHVDRMWDKPTPGRPGPLSGAFLSPNPMLSETEIIQNQHLDPLLVKLNHGERFSLLENRGKFTLVVARFYGKQVTWTSGKEEAAISKILKNNALDDAAESARELVTVLRGNYDKEATNFNNVDAFIWHDRHESIVTVGSFGSKNDPAAQSYLARFGPKLKEVGDGTTNFQPEHLGVSGFGPKADQKRLWLFEPNPELLPVPRIK